MRLGNPRRLRETRAMRHIVLWIALAVSAAAFEPARLAPLRAAVGRAIADGKLPGAVLWVEQGGEVAHWAQGDRVVLPAREPMMEGTIFDAASLTKVVATAPSVMLLVERGQVSLDAAVRDYLPEFGAAEVTVRHLLTHTSGLPAGIPTDQAQPGWRGYAEGIKRACACVPDAAPGGSFRYSDVNFILLGEIVRRVSGRTLDVFAREEIFSPLGMGETGFLPSADWLPRIAPTEPDEQGVMLHGVVHDPTARRMGGVAGHAGMFSTAADLARFARFMMRGEVDGVRVLQAGTLDAMRATQTLAPLTVRRGLGWDIDSPYSRPRGRIFPLGSFGHTGFTGMAMWIDPASDTFYVFLSSRLHPDGKGNVRDLYEEVGTEVGRLAGLENGSGASERPVAH